MRNEHIALLHSQPISDVKIDMMDQRYISRVQWYLEHDLHCKVTSLNEYEGYLVEFPEGTVEETYSGQSTQWTHRTTIRLPHGQTLQKYVTAPLNPTQRSQTMLTFPNSILNGPEPPCSRRD